MSPFARDFFVSPEPRRRTHVLEPPCVGRRSYGRAVCCVDIFRGRQASLRVPLRQRSGSGRTFEHCIHSVEARFGIPMRVVITDRYDCILREWKFGKGCPK